MDTVMDDVDPETLHNRRHKGSNFQRVVLLFIVCFVALFSITTGIHDITLAGQPQQTAIDYIIRVAANDTSS